MRRMMSEVLKLRFLKVGAGLAGIAIAWFAMAALPLAGTSAWAQSDDDEQNAQSSRGSHADDAADDADDDDDDDDAERSRLPSSRSAGQTRGRRAAQDREHPQLGVTFYGNNTLQVRRVVPDSPADEAGVRRGDTIRSVNGQRVSNIQQLKQDIDEASENGDLELGVLRNGRQRTLQANLSDQSAFRGRQVTGGQRRNQGGRSQAWQRSSPSRFNGQDDDQYSGWQDEGGDHEQGWNQNARRGYGGQASNRQGVNRRGTNRQGYGNQGYGNQGYGNQGYGNQDDDFYGQGNDGGANNRQRQGYASSQSGRGSRGNRPFLGVTLDEEAQNGVWVTGVYPNSPAEQAGLRRGDEIISVDDQDIGSYHELVSVLAQKSVGEEISLEIDRNGRQRMIDATLASSRSLSQQRGANRTGSRQTSGGQGNGAMYEDGYRESGYGNRGAGAGSGNEFYDNQGGGSRGGNQGGYNDGSQGQLEMGETPYGQDYWRADRKVSGY